MGWSCRSDAARTYEKWRKGCVNQTGGQNTFKVGEKSYFFENSRKEHVDGAITGTIWRILDNGKARRSGSFRIEGDGKIKRAPAILKSFIRTA